MQMDQSRTKGITRLSDELPPLSRLLLPLGRQLYVVPASKAVLQVPLGLSMPMIFITQAPQRRGRERTTWMVTDMGSNASTWNKQIC